MSVVSFDAVWDLSLNARAPLAAWAPALIGRPFADRARGPDAFDCMGLIEFVAAALGRPTRSYAAAYNASIYGDAASIDALIAAEQSAWAPGDGSVGDVLIMGSARRAHHVGVLCGAGHVLHVGVAEGVKCELIVGRRRVRRAAGYAIYGLARPA